MKRTYNFERLKLALAYLLLLCCLAAPLCGAYGTAEANYAPADSGGSTGDYATNSIAIGAGTTSPDIATVNARQSVAIGGGTSITGVGGSVAIGYNAQATDMESTATGSLAQATGTWATATGSSAQATDTGATATGYLSKATAEASIATGFRAEATGISSIAIGYRANASSEDSIAIGNEAQTSGLESIAIGIDATTSQYKAIAMGSGANALALNSTALGANAKALGEHSIAIGSADATNENAIAIGNSANASASGAVALGFGSVANAQTNPSVYKPTNTTAAASTAVQDTVKGATGVVSIGNGTTTRQLTNLAAGAADTDAVNVAQLKAVDAKAGNLNYTSTNYVTSGANSTAAISALDGQVKTNATAIQTNAGDITNLRAQATSFDNRITTNAGDITNLRAQATSFDSRITTNAGDITNLRAQATSFDNRITANTTSIATVSGDVSTLRTTVGTFDRRITTNETNIAAVSSDLGARIGATETNISNLTTNVSSLSTTVNTMQTDIAKIKSGDITVNIPDGNYVSNSKTLGENVKALDTQLKATDDKVGDLVYSSNTVITDGDDVTTALGKLDNAIAQGGSVAVGEIKKTLGDQKDYKSENIIKKTDSVITNLSALDANIGDLKYNAEEEPTTGGSSASTASAKTAAAKKYTGKVLDGDSLTAAVGKLNSSVGNVNAYSSTNYITQGASLTDNMSALDTQMAANVDSIADLYWRQGELGTEIEKVGARSAALAGLHPLEFNPADKLSFSAAYGGYRSQNAFAVGMFYRPSENVIYSLASTLGDGNNSYNLGIAFSMGAKRAKRVTAADYKQMGETIVMLNEKIEAQNEKIEALEDHNEKLETQNAQIQELMQQVEQLKKKVK